MGKLFDDSEPETGKEAYSLEQLKELENKIAAAIDKVKALKDDKSRLQARVKELETELAEKDGSLKNVLTEKTTIKSQIQDIIQH